MRAWWHSSPPLASDTYRCLSLSRRSSSPGVAVSSSLNFAATAPNCAAPNSRNCLVADGRRPVPLHGLRHFLTRTAVPVDQPVPVPALHIAGRSDSGTVEPALDQTPVPSRNYERGTGGNRAQGRRSNHPGWPTVLLALLLSVFRLLLDATVARYRSDASRRVELLVVRHQPRVLERQVKRPAPVTPLAEGTIVRRDRLGGLSNKYDRAAAR